MKLLITSPHHKLNADNYPFFVMDPTTKKVTGIAKNSPLADQRPRNDTPADLDYLPFGITTGEGKIFVGINYTISAYDPTTLELLEVVTTTGVPHTHEIKYADGFIYRANTSNDTVSRINVASKEEVHFSFKTMAREASLTYPTDNKNVMDVFHINAITVDGDNVYVLAHNRYQKRSEVFVMDKDLTSATKLANLDYACHDLLVHDGKIYSFGSQRGMLITLDIATARVTKRYIVDSDAFFLRGGVVIDNKIVVFANRKGSQTFNPFGEVDTRPNANILTIDIATGDITIEETDEFASIADLEILA